MATLGTTRTLTVLQTSDVHGSIYPFSYADHAPREIGIAKLASLIKKEREKSEHLLLIDSGDLIQGTPLAYHHARICPEKPNPMIRCLNQLGYDAAVLGNHEFNYGMPFLQKAIAESRFSWFSANLTDSTGNPFFGDAYWIKHFPSGLKVGVLGLTTAYIPNWEHPEHIAGICFHDPVQTARKWVPVLREQEKVDIVVVAYHGGLEKDEKTGEATEALTKENQGYELCEAVEGIDVLLTGHQHRKLAATICGVSVVQPGHEGRALGKVMLTLQACETGWEVVDKQAQLVSVEGVEPDPDIIELAAEYEGQTQMWLDQPIGYIEGDMRIVDSMAVRLKEHPFIEWINRVQMEVSGAAISNTALFDNASAGLPESVTMRDIVSNYIYPNTLKVLRVTGQDIKDALEQSAAYFALDENGQIVVSPDFLYPKPQHYNYDMWEGICYQIHVAKPIGHRIVGLTYDGMPLDREAKYEVVMNHYRAGGGGNYAMFQGKPVVREITTEVAELLAAYMLEHGALQAKVNHNWSVVIE
ncbi:MULTISPECIES: bifunctional UDP-sugar hydrolase/5'-nucleotidase [Brevibacillus]|uniref:Bifunctional metallophosphatase/5'-nucleotidase n=1 Tax=Brevibacillus invocatus TaxID=173959 RepID=A0A3M8CGB1_9BACL|nr:MULTISPECIES: bifunctional UDP-sugar hydrolase/5'-nucleotidase [Brevibacillus]MDH4616334.1 bifunctional metallophosphatase/5'-nucleotidase [Brevibacillus sp. AY1]RNB74533.1 bifunctional metallophosphatase/5'-nucleotidase [Brevibacillus invocatus]